MMVSRIMSTAATQGAKGASLALRQLNSRTPQAPITKSFSVNWIAMRAYRVNSLSKNMSLITTGREVKLEKGDSQSSIKVIQTDSKPLVVLIAWMMAKPSHLLKYAEFYLDQGFDVLNVHITPWQMLWPAKGSQVVAGELIEFLHHNYKYDPLMLHGFSVAGYVWGEVCVKILEKGDLYQPVLDRIVGQVWDSAADITEIPIGFPRAVFPTNLMLQNATHKYINYHMRTFHDVATRHYIRSSQMFHTNLVKAPALFLLSKTDPVGSEDSNRRVHDSWVARGVQTYWKCWDKSPHVGHYRKHPKEYAAELYGFLNMLSLVQHPEKIRAKL